MKGEHFVRPSKLCIEQNLSVFDPGCMGERLTECVMRSGWVVHTQQVTEHNQCAHALCERG